MPPGAASDALPSACAHAPALVGADGPNGDAFAIDAFASRTPSASFADSDATPTVGRPFELRAASSSAGATAKPSGASNVAVHGVAASPDGTRALAACGDGTVVEWDVVTGVERAAFPAHAGAARAAAYGGRALLGKAVSGGDDGVVRLWTVDGAEDSDFDAVGSIFRGHAGRVTGLAVGGVDGDVVASCGVDRAALLWDVRRGVAKASFVGHEGALTSVALGGSRSFLLCTSSVDRSVRFWDTRVPECVRVLRRLEAVPMACASCAAQPSWFATCGADGLTVLDARVWKETAHFEGLAPLTALAFHGESKLFAGDTDGRLYALDVWKAPPRSWE